MQEHAEPHTTHWRNPTAHEVSVSFHRGEHQRPTVFTVAPGAVKALTGEYDAAIHTMINGVIVGGLAPQLVDEAHPNRPLHSALRTSAAPAPSPALAAELAAEREKSAMLEEELTRLRAASAPAARPNR